MRRHDRNSPSTAAALLGSARRFSGLTQAQLAERASVSQQTISRIERGDTDPGIRQLNCILRSVGLELKVHLAAFRGLEVPPTATHVTEAHDLVEAEAHLHII